MTVKVTFEFLTAADAAAFLQDFDAGNEPTGGNLPAADPAAKRSRGRPRAAAADPAAGSPTVVPAAALATAAQAQAAAAAVAPAANAVPFKAVADAITELAELDRNKAVAVLSQHGVKLASDLKPEQFGSVVAACKAAMVPTSASLI